MASHYDINEIFSLMELLDAFNKVSETVEKLDILIYNSSTNLATLRLALDIKNKYLQKGCGVPLKTEIRRLDVIEYIKNENSFNVWLETLRILFTLQLSKKEFCLELIDSINQESLEEKKYIYRKLITYYELLKLCSAEKLILTNAEIETVTKDIIYFATSQHQELYSVVNYELLPSYFQVTNDYSVLNKINDNIKEKKHYNAICSLFEYIIEPNILNNDRIIRKSWFWILIQKGLVADGTTKKLSLYILKRTIDVISEENIPFEIESVMIFDPYDKAEFTTCWNNFILLFECLDETQTHLIIPTLTLLDKVDSLHFKWRSLLYTRLLTHNSRIIQKYAITYMFTCYKEECSELYKAIFPNLIAVINNIYLFHCSSDMEKSLLNFMKTAQRREILSIFLAEVTDFNRGTWISVPFYFICRSLATVFLNTSETKCRIDSDFVHKMMNITGKLQCLFIRAACRNLLLQFITKFYSQDNITLEIFDLVDKLMRYNDLNQTTDMWKVLVAWMKEMKNSQIIKSLLKSSVCSPRIILLLYDAGILDKNDVIDIVNTFVDTFNGVGTQYNIDSDRLDDRICLLNGLSILLYGTALHSALRLTDYNMSSYIKRNILSRNNMTEKNIPMINIYIQTIMRLPDTRCSKLMLEFYKDCLFSKDSSVTSKYFATGILSSILILNPDVETVRKIISNVFDCDDAFITFIYDSKPFMQHQVLSEYYKSLNIIAKVYFNVYPNYIAQQGERTYEHIADTINSIGREATKSSFELLEIFLPEFITKYDVRTLLASFWREIMDMKCYALDLFWPAFEHFIKIVFQEKLLSSFLSELKKYSELILELGCVMKGVWKIFFDQLEILSREDRTSNEVTQWICSCILRGIIHGPALSKDDRIERWVCNTLIGTSTNIRSSLNKYILEDLGRVKAIEIVYILLQKETSDKQFVARTCYEIVIAQYDTTKPRYYANSQLHLVKNRTFQILLVLQPHLDVNENKNLYQFVCRILLTESPQVSIRNQLEWLLMRILSTHTFLIDELTGSIDKFAETRISSLISVLVVLYQIAKVYPEDYLQTVFKIALPLSMGAQFNIRLYAQVVMLKLASYQQISDEKQDSFYDINVLKTSLESNLNIVQNKLLNKAVNDFTIVFDPESNFNCESIFYDLPMVCSLEEEALEIHLFNKTIIPENKITTKFYKIQTRIDQLDDQNLMDSAETSCGNFQKKIIPWKTSFPHSELLMQMRSTNTENFSELIVIASLIDKAPNLGGLSRTCEIFGVRKFVISNFKLQQNIKFQSLSVSADKWLEVVEVPEDNLIDYLYYLKTQEYTIVGCEQASESISLRDYDFPRKTALLLGNEKEGIRANILSRTDVCVEIPQIGVIRSLNVHVSGALCIWEYTRQHKDS